MSPRVCLLTETFHPVVGGGETHARLLSRALGRLGVEVFVLTRRRTRAMEPRACVDGVSVVRVPPPGFKRFGKYLMLLPVAWKLFSLRSRYDVVYVCGLRVLGVVGVAVSKLLGKRCVLRAESVGEMSGDFLWATPAP